MLVTFIASCVAFVSGAQVAQAKNDKINYEVQVARTSYGIPHVQGKEWGSLGYGYGYVFAQDNLCILARDVLVATGTQARYFGAGSGSGNLISDWTYAMVNSDARVNPSWASLDQDTKDLLQGYADGYNRYLRDKGASAGATECRGAAWVKPISGIDVYKVGMVWPLETDAWPTWSARAFHIRATHSYTAGAVLRMMREGVGSMPKCRNIDAK